MNGTKRIFALMMITTMLFGALGLSSAVFAADGVDFAPASAPTLSAGSSSNTIVVTVTNNTASAISGLSFQADAVDGVTGSVSFSGDTALDPGESTNVTVRFSVLSSAVAGDYELDVTATYNDGAAQSESFSVPFGVKTISGLTCSVTGTTVNAGSSATLKLSLRNASSSDLSDMIVSLDGLSSSGLAISGVNEQLVGVLASGETKTVSLSIRASSSLAAGYYELTAVVSYTDDEGETKESKFDFFVEVKNTSTSEETETAQLAFSSVSVSRSTAQSGDRATLTVALKNTGDLDAEQVQISVEAEDGLSNTTAPTVNVSKIADGARYTAEFGFLVDDDIKTKFYSLNITVTYLSATTEKTVQYVSGIYVDNSGVSQNDSVVLSEVVMSSSSIEATQSVTGSITVTNSGTQPVYNLQVSAAPDDGVVNKTQNAIMVGTLAAGASKTCTFTLLSRSSTKTGYYLVNFSATYQTKSGDSTTARTLTQYGGFYVDNPDLSDDGTGSKNKPVIIIDNYTIDPQLVYAGQEFTLDMSFLNTNSAKTVRNVKIYLTANESTEKNGSVFVPVGSSNTFYVEQIGPKQTVQRSLRLYTVPDAEQKTYTVVVNFEYEDSEGNAQTGSEQVGIPVRQETRMQYGQLNFPDSCNVGDMATVSLDFYNTGKQTMYNLMVTCEGDGFQSSAPLYYVGNFEPGSNDYYENTITPENVGPLTGKVIFSYEDASGNITTEEKEFSINVQEMAYVDPGTDPGFEDPGTEEQPGGFWSNFWKILIGIALLVVSTVIFLRIRKKRKQRQMDLEDAQAFPDDNRGADVKNQSGSGGTAQ